MIIFTLIISTYNLENNLSAQMIENFIFVAIPIL
jgi:hypothetical protein